MPDLRVIEAEGVSPDLIPTIQELLDKANAGEISSVAVAYVFRDGSVGRGWSTPPTFATLLGAVVRLVHRMNLVKDEE